MILGREIPTQCIEQVHIEVIFGQLLISNDMNDALQDLRELVLDCLLYFVSATLCARQVIRHLDSILSERALKPLHHVKEELLRVAQIHSKTNQVQASRASQAIDKACLDPRLELLRSNLGL